MLANLLTLIPLYLNKVEVYGSFELLFLAIDTVGAYLPTVKSILDNLDYTSRQLVVLGCFVFLFPIALGFVKILTAIKSYLDNKL